MRAAIPLGAAGALALLVAFGAGVAEGQVPDSFDPDVSGNVIAAVAQPDGKVLIGGFFSNVGGVARNNVARLHPDGSLDTGFDPSALGAVSNIAVQSDGKILLGGYFTSVGGVTRNRVARLHADGSLDTGFDPDATGGAVFSIALQSDGRILLGGAFTGLGGVARNFVARLHTDGSLDEDFDPNAGSWVNSIAVQSDGKILLGGFFESVGGVTRTLVARLHDDGSLDTGFDLNANGAVNSIAVQSDGKILLGGPFDSVGGAIRNQVARLHADGSLDAGFDPDAAGVRIDSIALQSDGKILLGGAFTSLGGVARNRIARLHADGSLDTGFDPDAAGGAVFSIALQSDGRLLPGGGFTSLGGVARNRMARLLNNVPALQDLSVTGTEQIDWERGGGTPEVEQVVFETWDGAAWVPQGTAQRVEGGWRAAGLSLPPSAWLRARGRAVGGNHNGSSTLVEQIVGYGSGLPAIAVEDSDGAGLESGGSEVDFGARFSFTTSDEGIFTIRNVGEAALSGFAVEIEGAHAADFAAGAPASASLEPGGSTTFAVDFTPQGFGARNASLRIASNDLAANPFVVALTGTGLDIADADLSALELSEGALSPDFESGATAYTARVANASAAVTVTAEASGPSATVEARVNGSAYAALPAGGLSLPLTVGDNTVEVRVTAADGTTQKTYTIIVTRRSFAPEAPQLTGAAASGEVLSSGPDGAELAWRADERANWHEVYLSRNGSLYLSQWVSGAPELDGEGNAVFRFNTAELPPGDYQWWVRSWESVRGLGAWSSPGSFTVACEALTPPLLSGGAIELEGRWPLALEVEGFETSATWAQFEVRRDGTSQKQLWVELAERGRASSYDPQTGVGDAAFTVLPDGDYQWRARTWSACHGNSAWSAQQGLSIVGTACSGPMAAPGAEQIAVDLDHGFSGAAGAGSNPVVTVSPGAGAPASWYDLWIGRAGGGAVVSKWHRYADAYDEAAGVWRLKTGQYLAAGGYLAYVRGFNECGLGEWSAPVSFTVQSPASLEVANLDVAFDGDGALRALWDVLPGVDWHEVWISSDGAKVFNRWFDGGSGGGGYLGRVEGNELAEFRGPSGSAVHAPGQYAFWVRTWLPGGTFGPWASSTGTSPVNLAAVPVLEPEVEIEGGRPRILWNAATAAGGYEIYLARNGALYHRESLRPEDLVWDEASRTWAGSPPTEYRPYWEPAPGSYQAWVRVQGGTRFGPWSAPAGFVLP